MANTQGFLYDTYMDYYKRAIAAKDAGDDRTARRFFILAAETLQQLALQSDGELKRARYETVKKLLAAAEALGEKRAQNGAASPQGAAVRAADDDADEYDLDIVMPNEQVTFDDIVGLDSAKTAIRRMLINPLNNPEAYKKYGLKPGGNILLEGPPGTGKTTFAKAAACEIELPFVAVTCSALVDSYIGNTAKNIDKLFGEVRRLIRNRKTAVILFCDEFDAIAKARGTDNKTADEAVPTLIRQLDGFDTDNTNIVILAATNIKDALDKAVLSRFGKSIFIPLPTRDDRKKLYELKIRKKVPPVDADTIDYQALADCSDGLSGRDIGNITLEFVNMLAERDTGQITLDGSLTDVLIGLIDAKRGGY